MAVTAGGSVAGAALGALVLVAAGAATPAVVSRLPRPRGSPRGDPGPDYAGLGRTRLLGPVCAGVGGPVGALLGWRLGALAVLPFLHLAAVGLALVWVDLSVHRLPDRLVLPSLAAAPLVVLGVTALGLVDRPDRGPPAALAAPVLRAVAGGVAAGAFWWLLHRLQRSGFGLGDVKLGAWTGLVTAWLSWPALVGGILAAVLLGGVTAAVVLLGGGSRRTAVPFGPMLLVGALAAAAVAGDRVQIAAAELVAPKMLAESEETRRSPIRHDTLMVSSMWPDRSV